MTVVTILEPGAAQALYAGAGQQGHIGLGIQDPTACGGDSVWGLGRCVVDGLCVVQDGRQGLKGVKPWQGVSEVEGRYATSCYVVV